MKTSDFLKLLADDTSDVPATLSGIPLDDLDALHTQLRQQFDGLKDGPYDDATMEQMRALVDAADVVKGEQARRDEQAARAIAAVEEMARRMDGSDDGSGDGGEQDSTGPDEPPDGGQDQPEQEQEEEEEEGGRAEPEGQPQQQQGQPPGRELQPAGARRDGVSLASVRRRTGPARLPATRPAQPAATIIAAADLPGIPTGAHLDFGGLVAAATARFKGYPRGHVANTQMKHAVAVIERTYGDDVTQSEDSENDLKLMDYACDQARLPGNSLVAAGGWCAPSETIYDLCEPETVSGMVTLPEIRIRRGGLRFAVSPLFSDIYSGVGFTQTEAQNIAGQSKPCYEIGCPSFQEVRLDAIGVCVTAGILQQRGYPEMVARVLRGVTTAHAHQVNSYVIGKMAALSTTVNPTLAGFGAWADMLNSLELQVVDLRSKYRLAENSTVEMVAPVWLKPILRADLTVRPGGDPNSPATDAQLDAHFRARGVNPQWVYDWQDAYTGGDLGSNTAATGWPTAADVLIYPAGTFVKGVADIIELSSIYDSVNTRTNSFTALFSEEGVLVARRCMESRLITFGNLCPAGRTGASFDYTCP